MTKRHGQMQHDRMVEYVANDAMFYVVFPSSALDKVRNRLKELNIKARLWEVASV